MVAEMKHFINGIEIRPLNADNIGIRLDFTGDAEEAQLNVDSVVLSNEAYSIVNASIENIGLFEGVPYRIEMGTLSIDYFVNLTENAQFTDITVECKIQKRRAVDWFMTQANSTRWELINKTTLITGAFDVPYIIVKDNQIELLVMTSLATASMTIQLAQAVQDLQTTISQGIQASTPNVGVPPSVDAGDIIAFALNLAAQIIKLAVIIAALIVLLKQLIELIVPKVRYLNGQKAKNLLVQGCAFLGHQFSSTALDGLSGLTILPVPLVQTNNSIFDILLGNATSYYNKKYPSASDSVSTVGSLIMEVKKIINGRVKLIGNTIHLERHDYWYNLSSQSVVNTLNLQDRRENSFTYNFGEMWKRYYLHYQLDMSDMHTLDKIQGMQTERSTEPINIINADLVTIKGSVDIAPLLSLGYRKEKLNYAENKLLTLATFGDSVVNFLGGNSSLASSISARIGVLQISQQHYTNTKLLYTVGGKQPANYLDFIGATAIYNNFHAINQVKENLKTIHKSTIPFSPKQFNALLSNNVVYDEVGNQLEIINFDYVNSSASAEIEYTMRSDKGNNTKTVTIL